MNDHLFSENDVAIVGMAGRFPGAPDPDVLWERVRAGDDCLTDLDRDALIADGVPPGAVASPEYVMRSGVLADVEMFDPGFFGIGRRDAAIMDPQHRHFIECVWEAIESAGHVPERFDGAIGLFAGCGANTYLLNNLLANPRLVEQVGWFLLRHTGNDKDFLTTTVSYKLDLRGPSVNVQTACSTSLVAVHFAVQSLLGFECDMAVAGGVTIEVPHGRGYEYREGEILAPDGYCRAFDERSAGTVLTSGAAVVALRRAGDALDSGDPILAIIKGSAVNNDGARKVGYLAPSVDGHADVVKEALTVAGVDARSIGLLEAHGTGTAVGDPIEVAALTEAFRAFTEDSGFCRLVSTKPNIGHLDTAAGTASLIKVVQALRHRTLPPLANHTAPSPLLDFDSTPFVLSAGAAPWSSDGPRRAGVSSLGVGGTNAHVVVEEAPQPTVSAPALPEQVLVLSGRDAQAVADASTRLADFLEADPAINLADVSHTLIAGRRAMRQRRVVVATDTADAVVQLRANDRSRSATDTADDEPPRIAFMFPGGGSQYAGMGAGLDQRFGVFHESLRAGVDVVRTATGVDLAPLLQRDGDDEALRAPTASLPAVFVTSVALARQWMAWGVVPAAMVGHSLGEYVAAHLAGVLSYEDALALVMTRSRLMQEMSGDDAAMLVVPLPEADVVPLLGTALSLAVVNARDECVVAGRTTAIEALLEQLPAEVGAQRIPLAAAAHSALLDPILPAFLDAVRSVRLSRPTIPYLSNLTGTWITDDQSTDPQYWVDHLRGTVRFADCLTTVCADGPLVLAELGPGHSLTSLARRSAAKPKAVIPGLRHPNQDVVDTAYALLGHARAWAAGVDTDLDHLAGRRSRRLRLPTYPFQRERCWIEPTVGAVLPTAAGAGRSPVAAPADRRPERLDDLDSATWLPAWKPAEPIGRSTATGRWVVVGDAHDDLVASLAAALGNRGATTAITSSFDDVAEHDLAGVVLVAGARRGPDLVDAAVRRWLDDATAAARVLGRAERPGRLVAVTRGALAVDGPARNPIDALATGVIAVAPREYPGLRARLVDVDATLDIASIAHAITDDVLSDGERIVAVHAGSRRTPDVVRATVTRPGAGTRTFRNGGTYLITGGLGGVGHALATHLATVHGANLVLVTSETVPAESERDRWLAEHSYDDPAARRIRKLRELEALGTKVAVVTADVAEPASLRAALDEAERRIGRIDGAIHAAGRLRDRLLEMAETADHRYVIGAKAGGALTLADELERRGASLLLLVSSTSTVLQPEGQASYVAANAVLDALAGQHRGLRVATINFGLWADVGVASDVGRRVRLGLDDGDRVDHPILDELSIGRAGSTRLVGRLDTSHHWVVDEHRTPGGHAVLPGTGHVELMLAAASFAGLVDPRLSSVTLSAPLVVGDDGPTTVRVTVTPGEEATVVVESDGGSGTRWLLHSEAHVGAAERGVVPPPIPGQLPLDGGDPLAGQRRHLDLGPRWDAIGDVKLGEDAAAADVQLPEPYAGEAARWFAHPALVDVATAVGVALAPRHGEQVLYVPVGYESVWVRSPLPDGFHVEATRSTDATPELLVVDVVGRDAAGDAVLVMCGLDLLAVTAHDHLGEVQDEPAATQLAPHRASLVELADELGIVAAEGAELVERLVASSHARMIGSTIDLDDLRRRLDAVEESVVGDPAVERAARGTSVEDALRIMWVELLGLDTIADDDDFFELGGHSLVAIRLMSSIHRELGVRLQLAAIFETPTIEELARRLREERPELDAQLAQLASNDAAASTPPEQPSAARTSATPMTRHLVPISRAGDKSPLYIVHGAGGNVLFLWSLARAMANDRPIFGFQAHGIEGDDMPDPSIEAMAARYVAELCAHAPEPYLLGGFSGGGIVTLEMARQLQASGKTVELVVLFDSPPAGVRGPGRLRRKRQVAEHLVHRGYWAVRPYLRLVIGDYVRRVIPARARRVADHDQDARALGYTDTGAHGFVNLFYYFSAAADRYTMRMYDVDVLLLKADQVWPSQPWDYHWTPYVNGALDILTVPGDHHSMFYPENAPTLARVLGRYLEERGH